LAIQITDAAVEAAAKAMYEFHVKEARAAVDQLRFDTAELREFAKRLRSESITGQILIFYSYLDDRILHLLKLHLKHLNTKVADDLLFGMNGPLSTFSSRVLLSYHLGWLSDEQKLRLDAFRKVRNQFAHRAFKVTLDDPQVASQLALLDYDLYSMLSNALPKENLDRSDINSILCKLVFLALKTFEDLLITPIAMTHHVHPQHVLGTRDDQPRVVHQLGTDMIHALLVAAGYSADDAKEQIETPHDHAS